MRRACPNSPRRPFACAACCLAFAIGGATAACASEPSPACDSSIPTLKAPAVGCETITFTVEEDQGCSYDGAPSIEDEEQWIAGAWLRLRHSADVAARVRFRSVSLPRPPIMDGPDAPYAFLTTARAGPCMCTAGELQALPLPLDDVFEWPLLAGQEQQVLLRPVGAVFDVSVCAGDADPYPVCMDRGEDPPACEGGIPATGSDTHCACLPPCVADEDCPVPISGNVTPLCDAEGQCVLPCETASDVCPDGQECVPATSFVRVDRMCMKPNAL